jgi:hypothetical protein
VFHNVAEKLGSVSTAALPKLVKDVNLTIALPPLPEGAFRAEQALALDSVGELLPALQILVLLLLPLDAQEHNDSLEFVDRLRILAFTGIPDQLILWNQKVEIDALL